MRRLRSCCSVYSLPVFLALELGTPSEHFQNRVGANTARASQAEQSPGLPSATGNNSCANTQPPMRTEDRHASPSVPRGNQGPEQELGTRSRDLVRAPRGSHLYPSLPLRTRKRRWYDSILFWHRKDATEDAYDKLAIERDATTMVSLRRCMKVSFK